jgi:outer membrane protein insertion porin family
MKLLRLFSICALISGVAVAQESIIHEIVISDSGEWGSERVRDLLGMSESEEISEAALEKGLKRLANTGRFQGVEASFDSGRGRLLVNLRLFDVLENIEILFADNLLSPALRNLIRKDVLEAVALNAGDQISLDQLSDVRGRILRRIQSRGFRDADVVLALEETDTSATKKLFVSLNMRSQEMVQEIEFQGFDGNDLLRLRSILERTDYIRPYLSALDVPHDLVDKPEEYLIPQVRRLREANQGLSVVYAVDFPLDQVLVSQSLTDWGLRMRNTGYFDFKIESQVVEGKGKKRLSVSLDKGLRYNLQFKGNVNFWERRLRARVLDRPVRLGLAFNESEALSLLRSMYLADGFKDVEINIKNEIKDSERRVTFYINEGSRFYLGEVLWDGISSKEKESLDEIEKVWRQNISSPFHPIYFDERAIKQQLPSLLEKIKSEGYLQARFLGSRFSSSEDSRRIHLEIPLQLGPRFTLRDIVVEGRHPLDDATLDKIVNVEPGDLARSDKILEIAQRLYTAVQEQGFLLVSVNDTLEKIVSFSDSTDEVDLSYLIEMGPKVRVGQIVVDGLRRTKERVVLREFERENMSKGEVWNPSKLETIDQRLLSYGLFGNLRMQMGSSRTIRNDDESLEDVEVQERDLRISVSERPGGAIEFGPGYRTDLGVVAFGEYNYRNIGGLNRSVVLRSQFSRKIDNFQFYEQRHSLSFLEPYFLNIPWAFRFATRYEKRDETQYDKDNIVIGGFNKDEVSLAFAIGKEFTRNISLLHNIYSISKPRIFDLQDDSDEDTQSYRIATMGPTLTFDFRDNIFNPSSGVLFSTSFEYASPDFGSSEDVHYFLSKNDISYYLPVRRGLVWANSFYFSHMRVMEKDLSLPVDRRLALGGRNSVRSLPEKSIRYDQQGVERQESYLLKTELRQKLFQDLGLAFFFDMGRVDAKGFVGDGWRESLGVGLRYITPVGPLSLDFAFNADQREREDFSRILFSVGVF